VLAKEHANAGQTCGNACQNGLDLGVPDDALLNGNGDGCSVHRGLAPHRPVVDAVIRAILLLHAQGQHDHSNEGNEDGQGPDRDDEVCGAEAAPAKFEGAHDGEADHHDEDVDEDVYDADDDGWRQTCAAGVGLDELPEGPVCRHWEAPEGVEADHKYEGYGDRCDSDIQQHTGSMG